MQSVYKYFGKRALDIILACLGIIILFPVIMVCIILSSIAHGESGIFIQTRMGRGGKNFRIFKIKTMISNSNSTFTVANQKNISDFGLVLRRFKIDELPQLFNVFRGDMSLVGPRPDVPEMYHKLDLQNEIMLSVRPGITGPAQIEFRNEEKILAKVDNPQTYAREVLWPLKLKINRNYAKNYTFLDDIKIIIRTLQ